MTAGPRLWLVSPVYFDTEAWLALRERLRAVVATLDPAPAEVHYVVVDDSAGLDPAISGLAADQQVTVLQPPFNLGHQRALVYGLRTLKEQLRDEDLVVTLDADGEDQPQDLPRLVEPLLRDPADRGRVVLALRTRRRESLPFKLLYAAFKLLFVMLTGTVVRTGNFAAYRGWTARRLLGHPHFDLCYSSSLLATNRPLVRVPCERGARLAGTSRMGYLKLLVHGVRMLMPFLDRIAVRALVGFFVTFAVGMGFVVWVLYVRLFSDRAIPGWATTTLLLVLLMSFTAMGNFVILFALYSQSLGVSLGNLDREHRG